MSRIDEYRKIIEEAKNAPDALFVSYETKGGDRRYELIDHIERVTDHGGYATVHVRGINGATEIVSLTGSDSINMVAFAKHHDGIRIAELRSRAKDAAKSIEAIERASGDTEEA